MISLVNCLMNKYPEFIPARIDFNKPANINLEAIALSYILVVLIISCIYNPADYSSLIEGDKDDLKTKFSFLNWFNQMQNRLMKIKNDFVAV